ncbi:MAG: hypothetical protein V6Z89_04430 [Desulfobacter sp.]
MNPQHQIKPFVLAFTAVLALLSLSAANLSAAQPRTFAVLPFTVNADKDMAYVKKGISQMFFSRLSWPEQVSVIPPKKIEAVRNALKGLPENKLIKAVAENTGTDYVLIGSITQLAGSFSIDARVFDIENKRFMSFFEQSKESDDLIEKVDRIAATINQRIFDRSTVTWEKMEQEKKAYLNDLKRKNPEHLMKLPPGWQPEEEVGWKVWKYLF